MVLSNLSQCQYNTLLITDYRCLDHAPFLKPQIFTKKCEQRDNQPENADRLAVLVDKENGVFTCCTEFTEGLEGLVIRDKAEEVCVADIFKVHDFNYILKIVKHMKRFEGTKNKIIKPFDGQDTASSEKTWQAALIAAGAVIQACDAVMNEEFRNAFCATRPPGHHAGIFGKTYHDDDPHGVKACSNGFCFINNVALAAAYLKSQYRQKIKKVAIVDFDIHHGNGTQEIIEALIKPKAFTLKTDVSPFATSEITTH